MADKRRLTFDGTVHIKDYEVVGSDEICNWDIGPTKKTLYPEAPWATILSESFECGAECRTEVNIAARLLNDGTMRVNVASKFFEGSSAGSDELEDEKYTNDYLISKSSPITLTHNLVNVDFPGDDTSTVTLNFFNSPIEDD